MEDWQIWFCCLHGSLLWCDFCFCWDWSLNCGEGSGYLLLWSLISLVPVTNLIVLFCFHLLLWQVSISFAKILLQVTRPRTAILGRLPRTTVYRNIQQYPEATKIPGLLIVRVDSAIYFSNSNYVKERCGSLYPPCYYFCKFSISWWTSEIERKQPTSSRQFPRITSDFNFWF